MIPTTNSPIEKAVKALKLAGFTDLQAKVLALIFPTNRLDWGYFLEILEEKKREENK